MALDTFVARRLQMKTVAVSQGLGVSLGAQFGTDRVVTIRNGVDVLQVRQQADGPSPDLDRERIHVAFVGRMVAVKRIDLLLRTASLLQDRHGMRFHFHLLGDGPLRPAMEKLARELAIQGCCTFLGFVPNPLPYLRKMDALILTSDHEGTPMVVLEALALGVPVVGPAVGGITEMLAEFPELLARTQDAEEYASRLLAATETSPERRGQIEVPDAYTIESAAEQYVEMYSTLKAQRQHTRLRV
jgi:glycosyltransferase involved in cell wall biosynthesis